ncbi:hypothetical protein [Falsiroseomonas sp. HW251]|uniref:hypothetical protein n=1 Tax=Falsiroseomonas sp. HW251 TaxID=3390998 RepID=UPI003D31CC49
MAERPPHQRWIKRPPRPSRGVQEEFRVPPGMPQFLLACAVSLVGGVAGAVIGPLLAPDRAGMAGLFAGLGFVLTFMGVWSAMGGTREDVRKLFR